MCVKRCNSIILAIHLSNGISGYLLLRLRSCDAGDISSGKLFGLEVITNESYDGVISVALAMDLHWQSACSDTKRLLTTLAWELACRQKSTAHRPGLPRRHVPLRAAEKDKYVGGSGWRHASSWRVKESFVLFCAIL